MKLPGLFPPQKTASVPHRFFLIYFGEHTVRAALWQIENQKIELLTSSTPHPWKEESGLVDATDHALQELGKESEQVKQTLFALEPTWVNQQGILADKKTLFQSLTKELALEAVGFVVIPEAIIQYQLNRKGTSLQCFVIEILAERVSMTIVKNGKLGQQEMVGRSNNVVDDIKEGFARFQDGALPSLVFLYSAFLTAEELEEARQRLLELDLLKEFAFMQQPTFEVVTAEEITDIILQTGGRAVGESHHLIDPAQPVMVESSPTLTDPEDLVQPVVEEETEELALDPSMAVAPRPMHENKTSPAHTIPPMSHPTFAADSELSAFPTGAPPTQRKGLALPHHPVLFGLIGVVLGLLLLAGGFVFASGKMMSAAVNVELKSQTVSKQLELKLDPQVAASDSNTGVLKAEIVKQTATGEKTAETTGKKIIGDKATGKVIIFNRTSSPKTFQAGTVFSDGTHKFLLDKTETVASASTDSSYKTIPGQLETTATAQAIGSESNIAKDVELTIDTFSKDTYVARTNAEFSGGTSREIKAVSQKDQDDLLTALKKELNDQAVKQLQEQAGSGKYVFPTNRVKVTASKFSAEVGKETNTFSLSLTVEAEALAYSADELKALASQVVAGSVPAGYGIADDQLQLLTEPITTATASAQVSIKADISGAAKPQAKAEEWKQEIAGKTEAEALAILKGKPEIANATIVLQPALFARFDPTLPTDLSKITLQLQ